MENSNRFVKDLTAGEFIELLKCGYTPETVGELMVNSELKKMLIQLKEVNEAFKNQSNCLSEKTNVRYITEPDDFSDHIGACIDMILVLIADDLREQLND
ncbi:MAG: hypothetical protein BGO34_01630 [Bacteroidia bacterium 44-10]|nr:MAG: hypothetical protein BGO34_01630 [Bacteroidia bacterium 44-10]